MRNVKRKKIPGVLKRNQKKWTDLLLREIERCKHSGTKVAGKFYDKYQAPEIRETLKAMYKGRCCYCESVIEVVGYTRIEHKKPKRKKKGSGKAYPEETYNWANLHLSCEHCNGAKSDQYDEQSPILDAVIDIPIKDFLTYRLGANGVLRWPLKESPRGDTTIRHADLNRENLYSARLKVWIAMDNLISDIRESPIESVRRAKLAELEHEKEEPHGTIVKFLLEKNNMQ